jgi:transposase-like protein
MAAPRKRRRRKGTESAEDKNPGGRPSKFTPEAKERILLAIRSGNWLCVAARAGGITYETLREWLRQGEADLEAGKETEFSGFSVAVQEARDWVEMRNVGFIQVAARKNWSAAAWWLEKSRPDRWGKKPVQPISGGGPDEPPVNVNVITAREVVEVGTPTKGRKE